MPGVWRASPMSSAGRSSALVGMQAQNGHSPPTSSCSTIAVDRPALTRRLAAPRPPGPAPKTTASNCFFLVIVWPTSPPRGGGNRLAALAEATWRIDHRPHAAAAAPARGSCLLPTRAAERFQSTTRRRVVALTFDDGPGAVTASVLAQLRRA